MSTNDSIIDMQQETIRLLGERIDALTQRVDLLQDALISGQERLLKLHELTTIRLDILADQQKDILAEQQKLREQKAG